MSQDYETNHTGRRGSASFAALSVNSAAESAWTGLDQDDDQILERAQRVVAGHNPARRRQDEEAPTVQALKDRVALLTGLVAEARDWVRSELDWIGGADAPEGSPLHADHVFLAKLERALEDRYASTHA